MSLHEANFDTHWGSRAQTTTFIRPSLMVEKNAQL
ncbi:unnamed protein product [Timema podura]|uniref:Uncharacterized protein n=1 Tax=Timema podura TaxID=61482 RepID=A0ABN7P6R4_TIMPD|nr:unnamed protein product [Timema podura]